MSNGRIIALCLSFFVFGILAGVGIGFGEGGRYYKGSSCESHEEVSFVNPMTGKPGLAPSKATEQE